MVASTQRTTGGAWRIQTTTQDGHVGEEPLKSARPAFSPCGKVEEEALLNVAQKVLQARSLREKHFKRSMFGEPAWDLLLALFITDPASPPDTVNALAERSSAPASAAHRWIKYLEHERLLSCTASAVSDSETEVILTHEGRSMLRDYLREFGALLP